MLFTRSFVVTTTTYCWTIGLLFGGRHPFGWQWNDDTRNWKFYTEDVNLMIEIAYEQWKFYHGPSAFNTPPITRFVDDKPQVYNIKFDDIPPTATTAQITGVQTNTKTTFKRAIRRCTVESSPCGANWFYQDVNNRWTKYGPFLVLSIKIMSDRQIDTQSVNVLFKEVCDRFTCYKVYL